MNDDKLIIQYSFSLLEAYTFVNPQPDTLTWVPAGRSNWEAGAGRLIGLAEETRVSKVASFIWKMKKSTLVKLTQLTVSRKFKKNER
jgi:hypothetical protein